VTNDVAVMVVVVVSLLVSEASAETTKTKRTLHISRKTTTTETQ
jgi:hypothetical protein